MLLHVFGLCFFTEQNNRYTGISCWIYSFLKYSIPVDMKVAKFYNLLISNKYIDIFWQITGHFL